MGRVVPIKQKKISAARKSAKKMEAPPPTPKELEAALKGLKSLTVDVKELQQKSVPSEYDIAILSTKLARLHLKLSDTQAG